MKSKKTFTVHLYQVITADKSKPLADLLEEVEGLSLEQRIRKINDREMRLEHVSKNDKGLWHLDFGLLRFDNGPGRASKKTPVTDFDLKIGEGFGEETAAIYDPVSGYLALQYNHFGARVSAIAAYLSTLDEKPNSYEFRLSLDDSAVARLKKKTIFTKIEMKVAPGKLSKAFKENNVSLYSALAAQQKEFGGDIVTVVVGLEKNSNKSLSIANKITSLLGLASDEPDAVSTLQVSGKDSQTASIDLVDLLEESRTTQFKDLPLSSGLRYPLSDRFNRLQRAFNGWKADKAIP